MAKKVPQIVKKIQKNPPDSIDYSFQKNVSYSQLAMYKQCPHKWKLHYKDKIPQREPNIYMIFGIAIHETIQHYLTVFYEKSKVKANEIDLIEIFQTSLMGEYKKQYKLITCNHLL